MLLKTTAFLRTQMSTGTDAKASGNKSPSPRARLLLQVAQMNLHRTRTMLGTWLLRLLPSLLIHQPCRKLQLP